MTRCEERLAVFAGVAVAVPEARVLAAAGEAGHKGSATGGDGGHVTKGFAADVEFFGFLFHRLDSSLQVCSSWDRGDAVKVPENTVILLTCSSASM